MNQLKLRHEDSELINTSVKSRQQFSWGETQHLEVMELTAQFLTIIRVSSKDVTVLVFWLITSSMFHAALADMN